MSPQRSAVTLLIGVAVLAACGSSGGTDANSTSASIDGDVVAVGAAPAPAPPESGGGGGIAGAVEVIAGAPGDADVAACELDQQTLQSAIDSYEILNGALPTSQQDLMDARMIRELSVRFEISADGSLEPAPGSPCT